MPILSALEIAGSFANVGPVSPSQAEPIAAYAPSARGAWTVFALAAGLALAFTFCTDHRWEDYYITFRAAKNLATGHGLVYQVGERVHSFTSPLGVLALAFTSWVSGGRSDEAALWLFRALSIGAFAGAAALVWSTCRAWGWRRFTCAIAAALVMADAKSLDFSINGMETGFMLLFLALTVSAFARSTCAWKLGVAWAGLMWTRPDSFIYIGGIAAGFWLFPAGLKIADGRAGLLRKYGWAAVVCILLYGPWIAWAWGYYGSPIPHTIVAKGLNQKPFGGIAAAHDILTAPWSHRAFDAIYLPSYYALGGWPQWAIWIGRVLSCVAFFTVFAPRLRPGARAVSFAFVVAIVYQSSIPASPWYVPPGAFLASLALCGLGESLSRLWPAARQFLVPVGFAVVAWALLLLAGTAWQLRWQQRLVEGQRREIGEWLRDHRDSPGDTVFLEPLGYIGYFSQLKMLDYPGMSSPEVVAARRLVGEDNGDLIAVLRPHWVVIRPIKLTNDPLALGSFRANYEPVQSFDVYSRIDAIPFLPGREYLRIDSRFEIFHRRPDSFAPSP
jgi:hypothetical protein